MYVPESRVTPTFTVTGMADLQNNHSFTQTQFKLL